MIKKLIYVLMAVVLAHVFVAGAKAAPLNKDAVAVIIGNKDYKSRIPTVDFAHNDADAFKAFVIDVLGYDPENIIDLRDASKAQLETAFGNRETHEGKLWRYISPKGISDVVVFYSVHGVPGLKDKRGYILPVDADAETPEINGFPVDTLLANLGRLKTKSMTVFLDACFSGDSQGGRLVRSTSGITIAPKLPSSSTGMTIITAAQGDQVASWDLKAKHGMFTKHLLDALRGGADKASYGNGDKQVSLGEVREYLDDRLTRAARREFGRHQNAWARGDSGTVLASVVLLPKRIVKPISIEEMDVTYVAIKTANLRAAPSTKSEIVGNLLSGKSINVTGRVSGKNWFRLNDGSYVFGNLVKPVDAAELSYWSSIKDSSDALDFKGYLARFPNGQFVDVARRLVEALKPEVQTASVVTVPKTKVIQTAPTKPEVGTNSSKYKPGDTFKDCPECPEMVVVPSGSFMMGSNYGDSNEKPVHAVTFRYSFAVGVFEVTREEWAAIIGKIPGRAKSNRRPISNVSWFDVQRFIKEINRRLSLDKSVSRYRLLSESEWEYVARAGTTTKYNVGDKISSSQANVNGFIDLNVGSFPANRFGIHDVHGNVGEWTEDCFKMNYLETPRDGSAAVKANCIANVHRGGGASYSLGAKSANRDAVDPEYKSISIGFRVARDLN